MFLKLGIRPLFKDSNEPDSAILDGAVWRRISDAQVMTQDAVPLGHFVQKIIVGFGFLNSQFNSIDP